MNTFSALGIHPVSGMEEARQIYVLVGKTDDSQTRRKLQTVARAIKNKIKHAVCGGDREGERPSPKTKHQG